MVKSAPLFSEIIPDFLIFIQNDIIVAHNASFDYWFISESIYRHTWKRIENDCLCTRKLTSRLIPDLPKKNLWSICEYMWFINERAHRAMWDTKVTVKVFQKLLNMLNKININDPKDILAFQNKKICDCINIH